MLEFLENDRCERCKGILLAEPHTKVIFVEESFDYLNQSVWICYCCGYENALDSQPYYSF